MKIPGVILTLLIFVLAYVTVTFIIEVQSVATVLIDRKELQKEANVLDSINAVDEEPGNLAIELSKDNLEPQGTCRYYEDEGGQSRTI